MNPQQTPRKRTAARDRVATQLGVLYDDDLAAFLRISLATLRNRRARGEVPPSSKLGLNHVTSVKDLERWLASRKVSA